MGVKEKFRSRNHQICLKSTVRKILDFDFYLQRNQNKPWLKIQDQSVPLRKLKIVCIPLNILQIVIYAPRNKGTPKNLFGTLPNFFYLFCIFANWSILLLYTSSPLKTANLGISQQVQIKFKSYLFCCFEILSNLVRLFLFFKAIVSHKGLQQGQCPQRNIPFFYINHFILGSILCVYCLCSVGR